MKTQTTWNSFVYELRALCGEGIKVGRFRYFKDGKQTIKVALYQRSDGMLDAITLTR